MADKRPEKPGRGRMSLDPKIAGLIGFATKSRKLLLGTNSVEQGIRQKKAKLVLAAGDINPKRLAILRKWCADMEIPFLVIGEKKNTELCCESRRWDYWR